MINILFIGDIVGKIGRNAVEKILPEIKKLNTIDLTIANAENSAHGSGITENIINQLEESGIDYFTTGDHAFRNRKYLEIFNHTNIVRPANFTPGSPGQGYALISIKSKKILLINLIGRVFMAMNYDCPFRKIDEILANNNLQAKNLSAIIVDIHAEATSEKVALGHYLAGRVSAVLGTHTHIMTADNKILNKGTAYITDVGMVGALDSCLGIEKEGVIDTFLTQNKNKHIIPEKGKAIFNSVLITINEKKQQTVSIKPIVKYLNIK